MLVTIVLLILASTSHGDCSSIQSPDVEIIGGEPVSIKEVPYMTALLVDGKLLRCGGAIVHTRYILTAAHCFDHAAVNTILVGTDNLKKGGKRYKIKQIIPHPMYTNATKGYDICLVQVAENITFGENVHKVKALADAKFRYRHLNLNITGWGSIDNNGTKPDKLLKATVPDYQQCYCQQFYNSHITNGMFCLGRRSRNACHGDSGGPVMWKNRLVGIISLGSIKDCRSAPTIATKISVFKSWINKTIAKI